MTSEEIYYKVFRSTVGMSNAPLSEVVKHILIMLLDKGIVNEDELTDMLIKSVIEL